MREELKTIIDIIIGEQVKNLSICKQGEENSEISYEEYWKGPKKYATKELLTKIYMDYKGDRRIDWFIFEPYYRSRIAGIEEPDESPKKDLYGHLLKRYGKRIKNNMKPVREQTEDGVIETYGISLADLAKLSRDELHEAIREIYNEEQKKQFKADKTKYKSNISKLNDLKSKINVSKIELNELFRFIDDIEITPEDKIQLFEKLKALKLELDEQLRIKEELKQLQEKSKNIPEDVHVMDKEKIIYLHINNYDIIEPVIEMYDQSIFDGINENQLEKTFNLKDLRGFATYSFTDIDDDAFLLAANSILYSIDNANNQDDLQIYQDLLFNICDKYQNYKDYIDLGNRIKNFFSKPDLTEEENKKLNVLLELFNFIRQNENDDENLRVMQEIDNSLNALRKARYTVVDQVNNKTEIKGFVLFDHGLDENREDKVYITTDLNINAKGNKIDKSIKKDKIESSGYNDFTNLVDIITTSGTLGDTVESDYRLLRPVFNSDGFGDDFKTSMDNSTGMYRVRPRNSSFTRFIERKYEFKNGSKKYNQIKDIFERLLPGAEIKEDFVIFVNFMTSLKCKDTDPYKEVKERFNNSVINDIFSKKDIEEFSTAQLKEIESALKMCLDAYKELGELSPSLNVEIINNLRGPGSRKNS